MFQILQLKRTAEDLSAAYNTAAKAVNSLINLVILAENASRGRTRIYSYEKYLQILRKDTVLF